MQTRIRLGKIKEAAGLVYIPEYKSAWYMPWRRITDQQGNEIYASRNPNSLIEIVNDVATGKIPPRSKKSSNIVYRR